MISFGHEPTILSALANVASLESRTTVSFKNGRLFLNVGKEEYCLRGERLTLLTVVAPIKLINNMPYSMLYQVIINSETKTTKSLESMQQYEIFRHKRGEEIALKINLPGFYWSHAISLN